MVRAADHRPVLSLPTPSDVAEVAGILTGAPPTALMGAADAAEAALPVATAIKAPRDAPTLARLHGMDEAVEWGLDVARDLAAYRDGRIAWADVNRGCLLSGPPGCGKTLLARALAATCGVPLITGSYGQWLDTGNAHQGDLLKAMAKTFKAARKAAPSVLFIDEVDSFPDRGAITHHSPSGTSRS